MDVTMTSINYPDGIVWIVKGGNNNLTRYSASTKQECLDWIESNKCNLWAIY